jgi:hypothetical protein
MKERKHESPLLNWLAQSTLVLFLRSSVLASFSAAVSSIARRSLERLGPDSTSIASVGSLGLKREIRTEGNLHIAR